MSQPITPYQPVNKIRIVTAASLFDGHDAAIKIMRRILQASGAAAGHKRSRFVAAMRLTFMLK